MLVKNNISNLPTPDGKPSIAVKVTGDPVAGGGKATLDLTLSSPLF